MSKTIKLKKGFDINLAGKPEKKIAENVRPDTYALKPTDFPGMTRPKLSVAVGDNVKAGSPVLYDKLFPEVHYTAPVSGEVIEIRRGAKRKILEIKILADKEVSYESFNKYSTTDLSSISREDAQSQMTQAGVWPNIVQRPFGIVANPADSPKSIFISTFDTHPLAPDYGFILQGQEQYFQAGISILKKFTSGDVNVNIDGKSEVSPVFSNVEGAVINKVSGPHPAGNVGVHIHHIDPIGKGQIIWTLNPVGVVQIGKLFLEGIYDASKIFVLAGSEVKKAKYYRTHLGACIDKYIESNLNQDHVRVISGNVLTGERIDKTGYIGYYDNQVTVIPEGDYHEMLGWIKPSNRLSYHRAWGLLSFLTPGKEYVMDTNNRGEERAFVATGVFEKVTPMDVFPTYLLKAIMAEDYEDMEGLGIYEVVEEDLALCEFVDVSKHEVQEIIRKGINLIKDS
ncbi:MAG: Na(+)-translocating NADH-quinone reductase subunit A [Cyclobacteriaceae bacterium]